MGERRSAYLMTIKIVAITLLVTLCSGCGAKDLRVQEYRLSADIPNPAKPPEEFYLIGAGDALNISIWKEPNISGGVKVRPDGFVTLPLVNEVQAVGMTTAQLRK